MFSLQFLSEINNIFHAKDLKRFTFYVKLIDNRQKNKQKNIESLDTKGKNFQGFNVENH